VPALEIASAVGQACTVRVRELSRAANSLSVT
jgi:hypothetical protein